MTPIEQLTNHLGFDPTKETGVLKVFDRQTSEPFKTIPGIEIKKVLVTNHNWFEIKLKPPNHRFYLDFSHTAKILTQVNFDRNLRATLTFPSGTLGSQP